MTSPVLRTVEMRWFFEGDLPPDVLSAYLRVAEGHAAPESRTDRYLIPIDDRQGIKLRQGGLEIKRRTSVPAPVSLGSSIRGYIESWAKWRFELAEEIDFPGREWIDVAKRRYLSRFSISPISAAEPVEGASDDRPHCAVELAGISLFERPFWSIGLEASGAGDEAAQRLRIVGRTVLSTLPAVALDADHAGAYPRLLRTYADPASQDRS